MDITFYMDKKSCKQLHSDLPCHLSSRANLAFNLLIIVQNFQDKSKPVMTAYKLVTIDAPYWGFGYRIEHALLLVGSLGFWMCTFIIFQNAMMHAIARQTPPLLLYIIWHRQLMSYIYDNNFLYVKICFASRMSYFCQQ